MHIRSQSCDSSDIKEEQYNEYILHTTTYRLCDNGKLEKNKRQVSEAQSYQYINQSIIIEKLEGVNQDCLNDANLPAGIRNGTGGVGTHKSRTVVHQG